MIKALIYIEREHISYSIDLVEAVYCLYQQQEVEVHAVCIGKAGEAECGIFDVVHRWQVAEENCLYDIRWMASCIQKLQEEEKFACIMIPATFYGRMLAPTLAMKLKTGLVADVMEVKKEDTVIRMVRPAFDGKIMAEIMIQNTDVVMMSIRPGVFQYCRMVNKQTRLVIHCLEMTRELPITLLEEEVVGISEDIRDAKVLVSGGGGVAENFLLLKDLAKELEGMISASRRLVDQGIAPRSIQVGQSGKIVNPKLYIALGIYGSLQHIEGLNHVEHIISVNKNRNAPICSLSEIVVEGDAMEFIEKLVTKIKKNQKKEK